MTLLGAVILWSTIVVFVAILALIQNYKPRGRWDDYPKDIPPRPGSSLNTPDWEYRLEPKGSAGSPNVDIIAPSTPPIAHCKLLSHCMTPIHEVVKVKTRKFKKGFRLKELRYYKHEYRFLIDNRIIESSTDLREVKG